MNYLFFMVMLLVPVIKSMEPAESQSEPVTRVTGGSIVVNTTQRKGYLSAFPASIGRMKTASYEKLENLSPEGSVPRDIVIMHDRLAQFDKGKQEKIFGLLKSLKMGEMPPPLDEFLKENDWLGDCGEINRFLQIAYEKRGAFTDVVIDSCLSVVSFPTTSSPTPTYLSGPASEQTYTRNASTFVLQQQIQNQQLQLQQSQIQLATILYANALQQKSKDDSSSSSSVDSVIQKCINPKKIKKIASWVALVGSLMASNSALSYFLGGQSSVSC